MPITTRIDKTKQLTLIEVQGKISFDEYMKELKRFWENNPTFNLVWNLIDGSLTHLSIEQLQIMADYVLLHSGKRAGGKTVFISSDKNERLILQGMRLLRVVSKFQHQIRVVDTMDEALAWLNE